MIVQCHKIQRGKYLYLNQLDLSVASGRFLSRKQVLSSVQVSIKFNKYVRSVFDSIQKIRDQ